MTLENDQHIWKDGSEKRVATGGVKLKQTKHTNRLIHKIKFPNSLINHTEIHWDQKFPPSKVRYFIGSNSINNFQSTRNKVSF